MHRAGGIVPAGSPFPLPPGQLSTPTRAPRTFRSFSFCPEQLGSPTYQPHPNPAWPQQRKKLYVTGPALRGRHLDSALGIHVFFFFLSLYIRSISVFPNLFTIGACYFVFGEKSAIFFLNLPKTMISVICPGLVSDGGMGRRQLDPAQSLA